MFQPTTTPPAIAMPSHPPKTNSFATAGLVCGILAWICCCGFPFNLLGLVFSLVALSQINRHPGLYEGRGLAIAGLVLSIASLLLTLERFCGALRLTRPLSSGISKHFEIMRAESQPVPPKISAPPSLTVFAVIVLGAVFAGAGAVVFFFNPGTHGFYPICLFHKLTGWNCPGCGGTRSLYALLHGNFALALKDNALFVVLLAAAVARGIWFAAKQIPAAAGRDFLPANILWAVLAVAVVFTVLRNLPAFAFLSP